MSPPKKEEFPFPKVGYVSFLEGNLTTFLWLSTFLAKSFSELVVSMSESM